MVFSIIILLSAVLAFWMNSRKEGERCFVVNYLIRSPSHFSDIILVIAISSGIKGRYTTN